jgi:hypothetical protein
MRPAGPESDWALQGPWQRSDAVALGARLALGLSGLVVAWIGCSGTVQWVPQQAWTAGAIGALVLALTAVASWLQTGLRNHRELEVAVLAEMRRLGHAPVTPPPVSPADQLVTIAGTGQSHRSDCLLVLGKVAVPVTGRSTAMTHCRMCAS